MSSIVYEGLQAYFDENPALAKTVIDRAINAARAREAARKAPGHIPVHCDYMDLMTAQGYGVQVVSHYKALRDKEPDSPDWHYLYGRSTGDPTLARKEFTRALELDPNFLQAQVQYAKLLFGAGDTGKAEEVIRQALARTDGNISSTAKLLGISRPTLYDLLKQYDLQS